MVVGSTPLQRIHKSSGTHLGRKADCRFGRNPCGRVESGALFEVEALLSGLN